MTYIPGEYAPPKRQRTGLLVALIAGAVVVSVTITLVALTVIGIAPWSGKQQAIHACEDAMTAGLKSPTTAKYVNVSASSTAGGWDVIGQVDAQNGFGAMVRTTWECSASNQAGRWTARIDSN